MGVGWGISYVLALTKFFTWSVNSKRGKKEKAKGIRR